MGPDSLRISVWIEISPVTQEPTTLLRQLVFRLRPIQETGDRRIEVASYQPPVMIAVISPSDWVYDEVSDHIGHFVDIERFDEGHPRASPTHLEEFASIEAVEAFTAMSSEEETNTTSDLTHGSEGESSPRMSVDLSSIENEGNAVLAMETGLFVPSLGGFPGPHTRYVEESLGVENLWQLLSAHDTERAAFRSTVAYVSDEKSETFTGETIGQIVEPRGDVSKGVEQLFEVEGETFAEMDGERKNLISSRSRALTKFADWKAGDELEEDGCLS